MLSVTPLMLSETRVVDVTLSEISSRISDTEESMF